VVVILVAVVTHISNYSEHNARSLAINIWKMSKHHQQQQAAACPTLININPKALTTTSKL